MLVLLLVSLVVFPTAALASGDIASPPPLDEACVAQVSTGGSVPEQRGCCSWHGGICSCYLGRIVCCDGALSPSCTCKGGGGDVGAVSFNILLAGDVSVRGYFRRDGTYVQPHMRSAPDGNSQNNWSTSPNVNPYTGQQGTRQPRLEDRSGSGLGGWGGDGLGGQRRSRPLFGD